MDKDSLCIIRNIPNMNRAHPREFRDISRGVEVYAPDSSAARRPACRSNQLSGIDYL
ncbi:hypothetical protein M408DRAFT_329857 [Serendipita vermifera MAFF 305830]|uniref:Uncharacterized protein n=1 Tax=Serendipita vermifera MAFF 305830 TaxID=933852 RepID=A0A0C2WN10_SERVB|nr:hypothetical protein M408DRAFT_329857 [Serendipita vermifera MAFF 305830]